MPYNFICGRTCISELYNLPEKKLSNKTSSKKKNDSAKCGPSLKGTRQPKDQGTNPVPLTRVLRPVNQGPQSSVNYGIGQLAIAGSLLVLSIGWHCQKGNQSCKIKPFLISQTKPISPNLKKKIPFLIFLFSPWFWF